MSIRFSCRTTEKINAKKTFLALNIILRSWKREMGERSSCGGEFLCFQYRLVHVEHSMRNFEVYIFSMRNHKNEEFLWAITHFSSLHGWCNTCLSNWHLFTWYRRRYSISTSIKITIQSPNGDGDGVFRNAILRATIRITYFFHGFICSILTDLCCLLAIFVQYLALVARVLACCGDNELINLLTLRSIIY